MYFWAQKCTLPACVTDFFIFLFLECRGGWASFQCKILATACRCAVPFHGKPRCFMVQCSVSMVWQTIWCDWLGRPVQTRKHVPTSKFLLSFYPFIPVIYLVLVPKKGQTIFPYINFPPKILIFPEALGSHTLFFWVRAHEN